MDYTTDKHLRTGPVAQVTPPPALGGTSSFLALAQQGVGACLEPVLRTGATQALAWNQHWNQLGGKGATVQ